MSDCPFPVIPAEKYLNHLHYNESFVRVSKDRLVLIENDLLDGDYRWTELPEPTKRAWKAYLADEGATLSVRKIKSLIAKLESV